MAKNFPPGYLNRFDPKVKDWKRLLFLPDRAIQSAELNELQAVMNYQLELAMQGQYKDGTYIRGGLISTTTTGNTVAVHFTAGLLWAVGFPHNVPELNINITGVGTEVIGLRLESDVQTEEDDEDLLDPAEGYENYGWEGAHREQFSYTAVLNDSDAIPLATFQDGQLISQSQGNSAWLDQLYEILAQRTYEESGSYVAELPQLELWDTSSVDADNPLQVRLDIVDGIGYVKGHRAQNKKTSLSLTRPMTGQLREEEPITFLTSQKKYPLANGPIQTVTEVSAILESPEFTRTRGAIPNGQDGIPFEYQPVSSIVSIEQGATTFVSGVDYTRSGNFIVWLPGGTQPDPGTTYDVVVRFTKNLTKGTKVKTFVGSEAKTVASGTFTLSNTHLNKIVSITNVAETVTYVEGTDYTYNKRTGVVTCSGALTDSTDVHVNYFYWNTAVAGDYLARDSWRDSGGNTLFNEYPTYLPSADTAVDYRSDIVFDGGAQVPVDASDVRIDYTFGLGRVDVLVWKQNGIFEVLPGIPGLYPVPVVPSEEVLPIARLIMPAESFAKDITIRRFDNQRQTMAELRNLAKQVYNIQYNLAQFQLQTETENIPTPTDKIGIFADPIRNTFGMDGSHPDFAGTIDFLGRKFSLPRTGGTLSIAGQITPTDAVLKDGRWYTAYTEKTVVEQLFYSDSALINPYGSINNKAKISLNPNPLIHVENQTVEVLTTAEVGNTFNPGTDTSTETYFGKTVDTYSGFPVSRLAPELVRNNMLVTAITNAAWGAQAVGSSTTMEQKLLESITPEPDWVEVTNNGNGHSTGVVSSNQWMTVLAETQIVASGGGLPVAKTISISGANFRPNDRAIHVLLDSQVLDVTPTGSTSGDGTYDGAVVADSNGNWTGEITLPAGTTTGIKQVTAVARYAGDLNSISSISGTTLELGTYLREVALQVDTNAPLQWLTHGEAFSWQYAAVFGFNPSAAMNAAERNVLAYLISYGIAEANQHSINVTHSLAVAAVYLLCASLTHLRPIPTTDQLDAIANAMNLDSTSVQENVDNLRTLYDSNRTKYWYLWYLVSGGLGVYDPLAQTFFLPNTAYISSVDLWFTVAPDSARVNVYIAETDNGYPTKTYLAEAAMPAASINDDGTKTRFTFERPILLEGGKTYSIVILTEDPSAAVSIARLGQTDLSTNALITKNPYSGALFKSPNAEAWELDPTADLKFTIQQCEFTKDQSILNLGEVTFGTNSSIFAVFAPFISPTHDCKVIYQYSTDNQYWIDFDPLKEVDLKGLFGSIYFRILMLGNSNLCPLVTNSVVLQHFVWTASGAYVQRAFDVPTEDVRYVDVWLHTKEPGNTSVDLYVDFDDETGWHQLTEDTDSARQITDEWFERRFVYDSGSADKTSVRCKAVLSTGNTYITPEIRKFRVIAR